MMKDEILRHLSYCLGHIDGLVWLCSLILEWDSLEAQPSPVVVLAGHQEILRTKSLAVVQNAVAEAGIVNCRKLLDFLGIKQNPDGGLYGRTKKAKASDVGIEDIDSLTTLSVSALETTPIGPGGIVRDACEHVIQAASKGIAHFAHGIPADAAKIRIAARVVHYLTLREVFDRIGERPQIDPRPWTAPRH